MINIFYLVPATDKPSWGMGIIYDHVSMLNQNGFCATIIKEKDCFVPFWLKLDVPIKDYQYLQQHLNPNDILVVPEAMLNVPRLKKMKCRKLLFIQASAYMFESMPQGEDHRSLGFEHVMIIMPHMEAIVKKHVNLPFTLVPPYVADYFYNQIPTIRKRQILLFPKFHQIDYSIVKYIVEQHINNKNQSWVKNLFSGDNWNIKELKDYKHEDVARTMNESTFFISLNTFEALNTSVAEAMASGCLVFCYEGYGPRDYLANNQNAFVFNNNEAYKLVDSVCDWIDNFDDRQIEIEAIRQSGFETASHYLRINAEKQLIQFFNYYTSREFNFISELEN